MSGLIQVQRDWLEVHQLPPCSPDFNPTERLWQHIRRNGPHNRFFGGLDALLAVLTRVFGEMQSHPRLIQPYQTHILPIYVPLFIALAPDFVIIALVPYRYYLYLTIWTQGVNPYHH